MTPEQLREIVFQNIGLASMCWSETPEGVFDTSLATNAGDEIMRAIEQYAAEKDKEIALYKKEILEYEKLVAFLSTDCGLLVYKWEDGVKGVDRVISFIKNAFSELAAAKDRIAELERSIAKVFSKTECCKEDTVIASIRKDLNL